MNCKSRFRFNTDKRSMDELNKEIKNAAFGQCLEPMFYLITVNLPQLLIGQENWFHDTNANFECIGYASVS